MATPGPPDGLDGLRRFKERAQLYRDIALALWTAATPISSATFVVLVVAYPDLRDPAVAAPLAAALGVSGLLNYLTTRRSGSS